MQEFFKIYGSAIGPTMAFVLGLFALYIKHKFDVAIEIKRVKLQYSKLIELVRASPPSTKFYPKKSNDGLPHADEARNGTNLARYRHRITSILPLVTHLESGIYKYGPIRTPIV